MDLNFFTNFKKFGQLKNMHKFGKSSWILKTFLKIKTKKEGKIKIKMNKRKKEKKEKN